MVMPYQAFNGHSCWYLWTDDHPQEQSTLHQHMSPPALAALQSQATMRVLPHIQG